MFCNYSLLLVRNSKIGFFFGFLKSQLRDNSYRAYIDRLYCNCCLRDSLAIERKPFLNQNTVEIHEPKNYFLCLCAYMRSELALSTCFFLLSLCHKLQREFCPLVLHAVLCSCGKVGILKESVC